MNNKNNLRRELLKQRRSLSSGEVNGISEKIFQQIKHLNIWHNSVFHIFLPIERNKEVNTWPIIHYIKDELGKEIILPKTNFEDISLENIRYDSDTVLCENTLGIPEPNRGIRVPEEKIEVVFVPLLAFNQQGHRIGYGKGFYDRFFAKCNENTLKIGLSISDEPHQWQEIDEFDVPLDMVVTPNSIIQF
jgi:5-formyltetrahydrofolate cyclo-ligase